METILTADREFELKRQKAQRNLLWLGIGSMVMVFAGLTSAYVVRRGQGWYPIDLPQMFWVSSAVIIFSSVTMNFAVWTLKKGNRSAGTIFLGLTLVLGLLFAWFQYAGWGELVKNGIYLVHQKGMNDMVSGSFIYVLSGLHLAHLAGGIIALLFTLVNSMRGKYGPDTIHGVRQAALYWHFLDVLWIYLFVFLTIFK